MNKKILAALCAAVMTLGLMCSCSEKKDTDSSSKAQEAADSSADTDTSSGEDTADDEQTTDGETTAESDITPAMWQITGENGAVVTFVGSMHALDESDYPLPAKITDAFDSSEILAVEADTSEMESLTFQAGLLASMYYDDPKDNLKNHISDEAYDALDKYLQSYSLSAKQFEILKPWAVTNNVENLPLMYSELSADLGFDGYVMDLARSSGKEIYQVEGVDFQMDMLMNFSDDIYDLMLRALDGEDKESQMKLLEETHTAWRQGDIDLLDEMNQADPEIGDEDMALYEEYANAMIYDRNIGMAETAKEFIDGDKNVLYVVGAAHFAGDKGIIALLEKDGYTVERIEY